MTVKTVYIPIILLPNILWHYFNAAFLFKPHQQQHIRSLM